MITIESIRSARQKAEEGNPSVWNIHSDHHIPTTIAFFMQVLAVTIRIFGMQNTPTPSDRSVPQKQRESVKEALDYFGQRFGAAYADFPGSTPSQTAVNAALGRFLFEADLFKGIFINVQNMFVHVGEKAAGDEKLDHYSGNSQDIMMVQSKPDKIGFWNYELCVMLSCGRPLLLDMWQKRCNIEAPEPVAAVVMSWVETLAQYQENRTAPIILAYDGYYNANTTREYCARAETRANVVVSASTKPGMFKRAEEKLHDAMVAQERLVSKPGDWCGIYNPTTCETLMKVFDTQKGVGVKINYSTAQKKVARPPKRARYRRSSSPRRL